MSQLKRIIWGNQNRQFHKEKVECWLPEAGGGGIRKLLFKEHRVSVCEDGNVVEMDSGDEHLFQSRLLESSPNIMDQDNCHLLMTHQFLVNYFKNNVSEEKGENKAFNEHNMNKSPIVC